MSQHEVKLIMGKTGKTYFSPGVPSPLGWVFNVDIGVSSKNGVPKNPAVHHVSCRKCNLEDCWDIPLYTIIYWQSHIFEARWSAHVCCYPFSRICRATKVLLDDKSYQTQGFISCSTIKTRLLRFIEGHFDSMCIVPQFKMGFQHFHYPLRSHWCFPLQSCGKNEVNGETDSELIGNQRRQCKSRQGVLHWVQNHVWLLEGNCIPSIPRFLLVIVPFLMVKSGLNHHEITSISLHLNDFPTKPPFNPFPLLLTPPPLP